VGDLAEIAFMPDYKLIKVIQSPGRTDVVLANPPLNILNIAMMQEIAAALDEAAKDSGLKALVFRAEGKHFSAGADVSEHTADKVKEMIAAFGGMFRSLMNVPAVTIAAVDGSALGGGCELATFCDIVLASDRAKFGQPEIQLGVFPPVAAVTFPRLIGRNRALELLTTGKVIPAQEAERIGLINHVYPAEEFAGKVDEFVASLTALSASSLALTKKAVDKTMELPFKDALIESDLMYLGELMQTHDANEGLASFLEKRKPTWEDK
jgi:cyclohexa-1,5-dienecarbonyl-CoA hydratase